MTRTSLPFLVRVEPTGEKRRSATVEGSVAAAERLLERARAAGHRVPRANFYANGMLVRGDVTRSDLAAARRGRCWCGRGALYGEPGQGWCSRSHRALWDQMDDETRARVIVARFLAIYGRRR